MSSDQNVSIKCKILEIIEFYRGIILDAVEQEAGSLPNWKYLRARLLKALGDRGLSKYVIEILNSSDREQSNRNKPNAGGSHE